MLALDPETLRVIQQWVQKAESDLTAAACLLKPSEYCPTDAVVFTPNSASKST